MDEFNTKIVLINEEMKWKLQMTITLVHILSLFTVINQSLLFRNEKELIAPLVFPHSYE